MSKHRIYSIAYGHTVEHSAAITLGLTKLPRNFIGEVCWACKGAGEREQRYLEGPATFACEYCDGLGLQQAGRPATESVLNQVLMAAQS